jgi:EmrB/QacA subfamily drug resistance transporter
MTNIDAPSRAAGAAPAAAGQSRARRLSPLPVLMAGTFMIVLDFFIVSVALPSMQANLHAGTNALEWVVAGYGLTFAVLLIAAGRLGDQFGRRRVFSIGLALFVVTSALCGLAPDATVLVLARLAQGVGGALIAPNVLSIIGVAYPGPARVRAITVYGLVMGLAAAGGQLIGGVLIQADVAGLSWRTVFLINVPVGLVALAAASRTVPESRAERASKLDLTGMALATVALTALVLPLLEGRQLHWPVWGWISLAASPVTLAIFARHQRRLARRGGTPLLDPAVFRSRALVTGLGTQFVFWCGQASFFLVFAFYLQQGAGLDALQAGLVFSILAAAYLAASMRAPALTLRFGRDLIAAGALALAAGDGLMLLAVTRLGTSGGIGWLVPGMLLVGAGMGLCITPLTTTVLANAQPEQAGAVAGALSTMQQVGNALGVAVTGVIFFNALSGGFGHAFALSLVQLGCLLVAVAALTRLIPRLTSQ